MRCEPNMLASALSLTRALAVHQAEVLRERSASNETATRLMGEVAGLQQQLAKAGTAPAAAGAASDGGTAIAGADATGAAAPKRARA